ncbi:MAG TPA: tyrosine-type recombinase/integrase [Armatimonadota bacterium]|jgi:site-specific recombinase XerD
MRIEPLYEEFLTYLSVERNCSPLTIGAYRSDGRLFLQSLVDQSEPAEIERITRVVVRGYIVWLRNRGLKPCTVARRIHSLRSFWNYLLDSDYTDTNPFRKLTLPKQARSLPVYLSEEECRRLLEGAGSQACGFEACRDRAILTLMIFTGARRSEVLNLSWPNVDLDQGTIRFVGAKGDKTRVVPLAADVIGLLREWRELRPACDHRYVFTAKWGVRLGKRGLTSALRRALADAGIEKANVTLHKLRHSFACLLLANGADLHCLQAMLGHTRLDTTGIYLHATAENLRKAMARHPLSGLSEDRHGLLVDLEYDYVQ